MTEQTANRRSAGGDNQANDKKPSLIGGIEGGATMTTMVVINEKRQILSKVETKASNPWLVGFDESAKILVELIRNAKSKLPKVPEELDAVGMSLSGAGQEKSRKQLREALRKQGANVDRIFIEEDILAPVFAVSDTGGVNMICGTGSNCVVYKKDGSSKRAGGWGHLLGDEAGGYWIAQKAIKMMFDHFDNMELCPYSLKTAQGTLFKYFAADCMDDLVECFYTSFSKDRIAGFTKELAKDAGHGDDFAKYVFRLAGRQIGRHIIALQDSIEESSLQSNGVLPIICTGSVFKSWSNLKPGIIDVLMPAKSSAIFSIFEKMVEKRKPVDGRSVVKKLKPSIRKISFVQLKADAAVGAAVWAAGRVNISISSANVKEICKELDLLDLQRT